MNFEVIDNFLPTDVFDKYSFMLGNEFPMFFSPNVATPDDVDEWHLRHVFYENNKIISHPIFFDDYVLPIINRVDCKSLVKARVGFYPRTDEIIEHGRHVDLDFPHKNIVFYLNTNDGFTRVFDKDGSSHVVESKANRILMFEGDVIHNSTTSTNSKLRATLAINYL